MTPDIDITEDAGPSVNPQALASLTDLSSRLVRGQQYIESLEAKLREAKEKLRDIAEVQLPEAMTAAGVSEFKTTDGRSITIKQIVAGSIPKAKRDDAFAWLRQHGHDGIIKRNISVSLAKGNDQLGQEIIETLRGLGVEVEAEDAVHPQTLGAWAREMLEAGADFPMDVLGIYVGKRATVK